MSSETVIRRAEIRPEQATRTSVREVLSYLPNNYEAAQPEAGGAIAIVGRDAYHWTLEDFVVPQLTRANIPVVVLPAIEVPRVRVVIDRSGRNHRVEFDVEGAWIGARSFGVESLAPEDEPPEPEEEADEGWDEHFHECPDGWEPPLRSMDDPESGHCERCGEDYTFTWGQIFFGDGDPHFPGCTAYRPNAPSPTPITCDGRPRGRRARGCNVGSPPRGNR